LINILFEKALKVCVSIREPMRNENFIIIITYLEIKAQCVGWVRLACRGIVNNICSCSVPSLACFFASLFRVKENFHALIVMGVIFTKV